MSGRRYAVGLGEADEGLAALHQALNAGPPPEGANLALLYASDSFAPIYAQLVETLRQETGIETVVGTVGLGIVDGAGERFDRPCLSVMTMTLPEESFQAFGPLDSGVAAGPTGLAGWAGDEKVGLALVSADPRTADLPSLLADLADGYQTYCLGGLTASRQGQVAAGDRVTREPGLCGVLLSQAIPMTVGLSQSCQPLTEAMAITAAEGQVIKEIEGQPALNALLDLVERDFDGDLQTAWPLLHPAFPVLGADSGDYLVRDFVGLDPDKGWLAVGELVEPGRRLLFCRRDAAAAKADLQRLIADTKARAASPPRAAVYISCVARGPQLFGARGAEAAILREGLGDIPITGFYAAGEIAGERLYGYTGVLALLS
ncbi:MAG: FIST C-terminal domain-containing protein [Pseudomonadota bacterium]